MGEGIADGNRKRVKQQDRELVQYNHNEHASGGGDGRGRRVCVCACVPGRMCIVQDLG